VAFVRLALFQDKRESYSETQMTRFENLHENMNECPNIAFTTTALVIPLSMTLISHSILPVFVPMKWKR